jgi:hypothetical protein
MITELVEDLVPQVFDINVVESQTPEVVEVIQTMELTDRKNNEQIEETAEIVESESQKVTVTEKEDTQDNTIESQDISTLGPIMDAVSRAYLSVIYINMFVVWFVVVTLIAGLIVNHRIKKRR